jgi:Flp pilus assembly protein TadG
MHRGQRARARGSEERGQAAVLLAVVLFLLVLVFVLVGNIAVVYNAYQRLAGYAEATARAGVEGAVDLSGYGLSNGTAQIKPALAVSGAQAYFAGLALGPLYRLTIEEVTSTRLSIEIATTIAVVLWGQVPLAARASETPQVGV